MKMMGCDCEWESLDGSGVFSRSYRPECTDHGPDGCTCRLIPGMPPWSLFGGPSKWQRQPPTFAERHEVDEACPHHGWAFVGIAGS